jgi:phage shock protein PspC (stress-responsive transcriptional regulator)
MSNEHILPTQEHLGHGTAASDEAMPEEAVLEQTSGKTNASLNTSLKIEEKTMEDTVRQIDQAKEVKYTEVERAPVRPSLYRHPVHRLVGGVCGGVADYLNIDPALVRILWIVLTLGTAGAGFLAYLALWLLLPVGTTRTGIQEPAAFQLNERNVQRAGLLLVGFGALWLLANLGILPWIWNAFWTAVGVIFWPALLIGAGLLLLKNQKEWRASFTEISTRMRASFRQRGEAVKIDRESVKSGMKQAKERIPLKRSREDRILMGVCGGLAQTFNIDANLVRLFWVLFSIGSIGTGALIYAVVGLILPERKVEAIDYEAEPHDIHVIDGRAGQ